MEPAAFPAAHGTSTAYAKLWVDFGYGAFVGRRLTIIFGVPKSLIFFRINAETLVKSL